MTQREAIDKALKKHETNCCMFERGVQTLDDLLASRTVFLGVLQAAQAQAAERCKYCDNTGDVHSPTGEWRGVCTECKKAAHQEPAVARGVSELETVVQSLCVWGKFQDDAGEATNALSDLLEQLKSVPQVPPPDHRDAPQAAYDTMTVECLNDKVMRAIPNAGFLAEKVRALINTNLTTGEMK